MAKGLMFAVPIIIAILVVRLLTAFITASAAPDTSQTSCSLTSTNATDNANNCANGSSGVITFLKTMVVGTIDGAPTWVNVPWATIQNVLLVFAIAEAVRSFIPFLPGG